LLLRRVKVFKAYNLFQKLSEKNNRPFSFTEKGRKSKDVKEFYLPSAVTKGIIAIVRERLIAAVSSL
jgi:hypothetical protein